MYEPRNYAFYYPALRQDSMAGVSIAGSSLTDRCGWEQAMQIVDLEATGQPFGVVITSNLFYPKEVDIETKHHLSCSIEL